MLYLNELCKAVFVGSNLRLEGLVPKVLGVDVLRVTIRLILSSDHLVTEPLAEFLAVLQILLQLQTILKALQLFIRPLAVLVTPIEEQVLFCFTS